MSTRKRLFSDFVRSQNTPYTHQPPQDETSRSKKSQALTPVDVNVAHPGSARGILRRLAKITARDTQKRVVTPISAQDQKENIVQEALVSEDILIKRPNFSIEESIEEDDSEIPTAPTPSALLDDSDQDEEPTSTFHNLEVVSGVEQRVRSEEPQLNPANSILAGSLVQDEDDSTFLTERGRRAISEEPTRMSRYSFGSIRMSDFGSTLEVKSASGRQGDLHDQSILGLHGSHDQLIPDGARLDHETEYLRNLVTMSPPKEELAAEESVLEVPADEGTFQLDVTNVVDDEVEAAQLVQQNDLLPGVLEADSIVDGEPDFVEEDGCAEFSGFVAEPDDVDQSDFVEVPDSVDDHGFVEVPDMHDEAVGSAPASSRRQTLLETVAAAVEKKPSRKKRMKLNQHGNPIPSLPSSLIKRVIHDSQIKANKRKTTLSKEHMAALEQATEWFFEQASEDLADYANHSRRKTRIDEEDALLLMRRQRVLQQEGELRAFAKDWLPLEVFKELELPD